MLNVVIGFAACQSKNVEWVGWLWSHMLTFNIKNITLNSHDVRGKRKAYVRAIQLMPSMHSFKRIPLLKASNEWCSIKEMPSIWMLLTLAPNSTHLFSFPRTMGRKYGRSMLTMRCCTFFFSIKSCCWRLTSFTAAIRLLCSVFKHIEVVYWRHRLFHWQMSLLKRFNRRRRSFWSLCRCASAVWHKPNVHGWCLRICFAVFFLHVLCKSLKVACATTRYFPKATSRL